MSNPPPPAAPRRPEPTWRESMEYPLAVLGAMIGAALGAALAFGAARFGFYAVVVVGVCTGLSTTFTSRRGGILVGLIAAFVALAASLCTEANLFPFIANDSLGYFFTHLAALSTMSKISQIANTAIAGLIAYFR